MGVVVLKPPNVAHTDSNSEQWTYRDHVTLKDSQGRPRQEVRCKVCFPDPKSKDGWFLRDQDQMLRHLGLRKEYDDCKLLTGALLPRTEGNTGNMHRLKLTAFLQSRMSKRTSANGTVFHFQLQPACSDHFGLESMCEGRMQVLV